MTRTSPTVRAPIPDDGIDPERPSLLRRLNWKRILLLLVGIYICGRYFLSGLGLTESDRVMQTIIKIEEAVENKSVLNFRSALSKDYRDRSGHTRGTLRILATRYFSSRDAIQITNLSHSIDFPEEGKAVVNLRIHVLGRTGGEWARGITDDSAFGEKYVFHLQKEGREWKITSVDPQRRNWPRN